MRVIGRTALTLVVFIGAIASSVETADARPMCFGEPATIVGWHGDDKIQGTDGDDVIVTFAGNDEIDGGRGSDRICAGDDGDAIYFGKGTNRVDGGTGPDRIYGGPFSGRAIVYGGKGHDDITGGPYRRGWTDRLYGGDGNDVIVGADAVERYDASGPDNIRGGPGDDRLNAFGDHDRVWGGTGDDVIVEDGLAPFGLDRYKGGPGRDLMEFVRDTRADLEEERFRLRNLDERVPWEPMVDFEDLRGEGDDVFYGDARRNRLFGSYESDRLYGRAGDDLLYAGKGFGGEVERDYLDGGAGEDTCVGGIEQRRCEHVS